ncbi:cytochrome-c peroxidase [Crocinitomix sp.]|nr:cytochrome-c peroxidase [Crocinitomix sp.]
MHIFTSHKIFVAYFLCFILFASCKKNEPEIAVYDDTPYALKYANNSLPVPNLPADNSLTVEKVQLGKMLFYDRDLSRDGTVNCAKCHIQVDGFSDQHQFSEGVDGLLGKRQAMAIFNLAWHENGFFWDGRSDLLRHQSLLPIQDPLEMDETLENVITKLKLKANYKDQFIRAFGSEEISSEKISKALEAFMFTIVSDDSKYDRYLAGTVALTTSEDRGRELFFGEFNPFFPETSGADCAHCHSGNNFENDLYMNNGLDGDADFEDIGREEVTGNAADRAKFKVTSLRNIAVTGPYMHDGRFNTLEEVVAHYNNELQNSSTIDPALVSTMDTGLMLDETDIEDLINFLHTLTDPHFLNNPEYGSLPE